MPIGSSQYGKQGYGRSGELKGLEYSKIYIGEINLTSSIVGIFSYYPKYTYEGIINSQLEIISSFSYYPKYSYSSLIELTSSLESEYSISFGYISLIEINSDIVSEYSFYPKYEYNGLIELLSSIIGNYLYYPKYQYNGLIELVFSIISEYNFVGQEFKYDGLIKLISSIVSEYQYIVYNIRINNYALPETFIWDKAPTYQKSYESFFVSDMHYITKENYSMITIQGILEGTSKSDVENKYKDLVDNVIYVDNFVEMKYKKRTYNVFPINVVKTRFEDFPQLLNVTLIYGLKNFKENEWT